jgi:hypothetical protein
MSSTIFTGPVLAGNVLDSDGTGTYAGAGGSSGTQNVGFANMVQASRSATTGLYSTAITQAAAFTAPVNTGIVIPAQSIITDIRVYVTAAVSASATMSIGTTTTATELANAIPNASLVVGQYMVNPSVGSGGAAQVAKWLNSSATDDVPIYVKTSATGTGTFYVVVAYIQSANAYVGGNYTA